MNLPFVYLRPVVDHLFTPSNGEGWFGTGFLGAQKSVKASQNSKSQEEFLAGLRFERHGKLAELHFDES